MKRGLSLVTALCITTGVCLGFKGDLNRLNADDITSAMSETEDEYGVFYHYKTGESNPLSYFFATRLIDCHSGDEISIENAADGHICFYDSNKIFVSGDLINQTYKGITYDNTFVVPENCVYFRLSTRIANKDLLNIRTLEKSNSDNDLSSLEDLNNDNISAAYGNLWASNNFLNDADVYNDLIILEKAIIIVSQDGRGQYSTISAAVNAANNGDTIFVLSGIYDNETIEAFDKKINIIGIDKRSVIIKNHTDEYNTAPVEIGAGSLRNLTVIAEKGTNTSGKYPYAVHIESDNLYNESLFVENCNFIAYNGAAVGMGMRGGCDVRFENCYFYAPEYNEVGTSGYGLYFHDTANSQFVGDSKLLVKDCILESAHTKGVVIRIDSQGLEENSVDVSFINNVCANEYYTNTYLSLHNWGGENDDWCGLKGYSNNIKSFGNNTSELNY